MGVASKQLQNRALKKQQVLKAFRFEVLRCVWCNFVQCRLFSYFLVFSLSLSFQSQFSVFSLSFQFSVFSFQSQFSVSVFSFQSQFSVFSSQFSVFSHSFQNLVFKFLITHRPLRLFTATVHCDCSLRPKIISYSISLI